MATGPDPDAPDWFAPDAGAGNGAAEASFAIAPAAGERSKETEIVNRDDLSLGTGVRGGATTADVDNEAGIIEASREPDDGAVPDFDGDIPGFSDWREELRERLKRIRARREKERLAAEIDSDSERLQTEAGDDSGSLAADETEGREAAADEQEVAADEQEVAADEQEVAADEQEAAVDEQATDLEEEEVYSSARAAAPEDELKRLAAMPQEAVGASAQGTDFAAADGNRPSAKEPVDAPPVVTRPSMAATARDLIARIVDGRSAKSTSPAAEINEGAPEIDLVQAEDAETGKDDFVGEPELSGQTAANDLAEIHLGLPDQRAADTLDDLDLFEEAVDATGLTEVVTNADSGEIDAAENTGRINLVEATQDVGNIDMVEATESAGKIDLVEATESAGKIDLVEATESAGKNDLVEAAEDGRHVGLVEAAKDAGDIDAVEAAANADATEIDGPEIAAVGESHVDDDEEERVVPLAPEPRRTFNWTAAATATDSAQTAKPDGEAPEIDGEVHELEAQTPEIDDEGFELGEEAPELDFDDAPASATVAPSLEIESLVDDGEEKKQPLEWDADELAPLPGTKSSAGPLGERAAAALCDLLVLTAIGAALVGAASSGTGLPFSQVLVEEASWLALTWAIFVVGYSVFFVGTCGQTIGRMVMRLRVVGDDQFSVGFDRAAMRLAAWVVSALPLLAGMLPALKDPQRRGLHDRLSHTRVVKA